MPGVIPLLKSLFSGLGVDNPSPAASAKLGPSSFAHKLGAAQQQLVAKAAEEASPAEVSSDNEASGDVDAEAGAEGRQSTKTNFAGSSGLRGRSDGPATESVVSASGVPSDNAGPTDNGTPTAGARNGIVASENGTPTAGARDGIVASENGTPTAGAGTVASENGTPTAGARDGIVASENGTPTAGARDGIVASENGTPTAGARDGISENGGPSIAAGLDAVLQEDGAVTAGTTVTPPRGVVASPNAGPDSVAGEASASSARLHGGVGLPASGTGAHTVTTLLATPGVTAPTESATNGPTQGLTGLVAAAEAARVVANHGAPSAGQISVVPAPGDQGLAGGQTAGSAQALIGAPLLLRPGAVNSAASGTGATGRTPIVDLAGGTTPVAFVERLQVSPGVAPATATAIPTGEATSAAGAATTADGGPQPVTVALGGGVASDNAGPGGVPSANAGPGGVPSANAGPGGVPSANAGPGGVPSANAGPGGVPSANAGPGGVPTVAPGVIGSENGGPATHALGEIAFANLAAEPGVEVGVRAETDVELGGRRAAETEPRLQEDGAVLRAASAANAAVGQGAVDTAAAAAMRSSALAGEVATPLGASSERVVVATVEQVASAVVDAQDLGRNEIVLRLEPPAMGTLRLRLVERFGSLQVHLTADSTAVRDLLQALSSEVRQRLDAVGLRLQDYIVDVGGQNAGQQSQRPDDWAFDGSPLGLNQIETADDATPGELTPSASPALDGNRLLDVRA